MPFFDTYKNINRGGITGESKTATRDALLEALRDSRKKDHVIQIVKTLLDFKAHQSDNASAERLLGNLANHVNVIGDPTITERSLHELVKNRSMIFQRDLPDTFKGLLRTMLKSDAKGRLIDTNTARILKSNSLITDADVRNATPVKRVGEQVLPSELAAFLTRTGKIFPGPLSATWTLSNFLTQLSKDYPRSSPTETQWKSLAYVVRQVSNGRFGSRINSEFQRNGQEINTKNAGIFKKKITSPSYRPTMGASVSMETGYSKGGHDRMYNEFLIEAKKMLEVCQINALHEAVGQMQERQEILSRAPRLSQHLPGEVAWRAPGGWEGASNPQHQQWLELRNAIDSNAFEKRQRSRDAEDREMTYALLACAGVNQMVTRLINCSRGTAPYDDNENALASRVANCLAPILGVNDTPESVARSLLCNLAASAEGYLKLLPPEWNRSFPERYVTTGVNVAARILHQTAILQIRLPGCQPVEDFHLYQTRKIRFSWDERANFITAQVVDHSDWMCSTREPQVAEDARFARGRF
jgi:hypothetical protein